MAAGDAKRRFEVVVWGATGFVGRLATRYLTEHGPHDLRWAIAGRTRAKLEAIREDVATSVRGGNLPEVLEASLDDESSVDAMVGSSLVVCALAGPYDEFGEPVVRSCARLGTHYVDITGEVMTFLPRMRRLYAAEARASGAILVSACGFDSIPSDLGTFGLVQHVRRTYKTGVDQVRGFFRLSASPSGGTLASMLGIMGKLGNEGVAEDLRDPLVLCEAPEGVVADDGDEISMDEAQGYFEGRYALPFVMAWSNTRVVRWSAEEMAHRGQRYSSPAREFSYKEMSLTRSYSAALSASISGMLMPAGICCVQTFPFLVEAVRPLLTKPGDGPDEETRAKSWFETTLVATLDTSTNPDAPATVSAVMRGGDPGYSETAKMVSEAALTLARDTHALHPATRAGGFFSPATALGNTLLTRLTKAGIHFEILE